MNTKRGYVQGEWNISKVLKFFASGRVDKNSFVDKPFVSPRAALVIKPDARNNIRLSFNRAFTSPSALNTSLDVLNTKDAFGYTSILGNGYGIDGRGIGNRDGFIFSHDQFGTLQYRSPFTPNWNPNGTTADYVSLNNSSFNNTALTPVGQIIAANMIAQGVPSGLANVIAQEVITTNPNSPTIGNNLIMLDLDKQEFLPQNAMQPQDVKDIPKVKNQSTITYEIGYSGIIKERIMLTIDAYRSDISDFVSALKLQTPSVFMNYDDLLPVIQQNIDSAQTPNLNTLITFVFDDPANGGNGNGSGADELAKLVSGVPIGTVSPGVGTDPALMLTFGNFGRITVYGFDIGAKYYLTENLRLGATYSFVNKNEFQTEGYTIPLNAPRHKVNLSVQYDWKKTGLDLGLRWRWQDAFPGNSGVYVGMVNAINQIDGTVTYTLPFLKTMKVNVTVTNILNNNIREFVGAPYMGRLTMGRISYTF